MIELFSLLLLVRLILLVLVTIKQAKLLYLICYSRDGDTILRALTSWIRPLLGRLLFVPSQQFLLSPWHQTQASLP